MLENNEFEPKVAKKINRIKIATINIKKLYEDLVFLRLNKSTQSHLEMVDLDGVLSERMEYFKLSQALQIYFEKYNYSNKLY